MLFCYGLIGFFSTPLHVYITLQFTVIYHLFPTLHALDKAWAAAGCSADTGWQQCAADLCSSEQGVPRKSHSGGLWGGLPLCKSERKSSRGRFGGTRRSPPILCETIIKTHAAEGLQAEGWGSQDLHVKDSGAWR